MKIRLIVLSVVLLCVGCGPNRQPAESPTPVPPSSLIRVYRDFPRETSDTTYTNRRIVCRIEGGNYVVLSTGIGYHTGFADTPPVIVFVCTPPPDNKSFVEIIGTCRGISRDGHRRGPGIDWYITVDSCSVSFPKF